MTWQPGDQVNRRRTGAGGDGRFRAVQPVFGKNIHQPGVTSVPWTKDWESGLHLKTSVREEHTIKSNGMKNASSGSNSLVRLGVNVHAYIIHTS